VDGSRVSPIAVNMTGLRRGLDMYDVLIADAKNIGQDEARLVEIVGREQLAARDPKYKSNGSR
jgi:hypothetical protein